MKFVLLALALTACAADDTTTVDPGRCEPARTYRIDQVELPRGLTEARELGLDVDGDGIRDNVLGQVNAALTTMFASVPLDLQTRANAHLAGDTDWRIAIADCGDAQRLIAVGEPDGLLALPGTGAGARTEATSDGFAAVPLVALFDGSGDARSMFATAERTRLDVTESGDSLTGTLAVGIAEDLASPLVIYGMTDFLDRHLDDWRDEVDADGDGVITQTEIAHNSFAQSLLGPDLVLDEVRALSLTLPIRATRVDR